MLRWTTKIAMLKQMAQFPGLWVGSTAPHTKITKWKYNSLVLPPTNHPATSPQKSTINPASLVPPLHTTAPAGFRPSAALHPHEFGQRQYQPPSDIALRSLASKENWAPGRTRKNQHAKSASAHPLSLRLNQLHQQKIPQILVDSSNQPPAVEGNVSY